MEEIYYTISKKKVHFHILDVSRVLYAKKVKLPFTQKKRKDIFIPPNVFPRKICLPSKYRATSYNRILNVTLSLSLSLYILAALNYEIREDRFLQQSSPTFNQRSQY